MKIKRILFIVSLCASSLAQAKLLKIYNNTGETIKVIKKIQFRETPDSKKTELKNGETKKIRIPLNNLKILYCGDGGSSEEKIKPLEFSIEIQQTTPPYRGFCYPSDKKFKIRPLWGKKKGKWRNLKNSSDLEYTPYLHEL